MTLDTAFEQPSRDEDFIPLEEAKQIIIDSLMAFDPILGTEAKAILYNDDQTNIITRKEPVTNMMACRPAGSELEDVIAAGTYIEGFEERFGPDFKDQANPLPFAVIDFEYHGTSESVIYLAHELGHAIADKLHNEAGFTFRDNPADMPEKQAYFIQNIVMDTLNNIPLYKAAIEQDRGQHVASYHDPQETEERLISYGRAKDYVEAATLYNKARDMNSTDRHELALSILGANGPMTSAEIFTSIGIDNLDTIEATAIQLSAETPTETSDLAAGASSDQRAEI